MIERSRIGPEVMMLFRVGGETVRSAQMYV